MVEFTIGRNIKAGCDKLIMSSKKNDIIKLLNKSEQILVSAIKKQNVSDKVTEYNLGTYKVYIALINSKQNPVSWQRLGGEIWKKIKSAREVKVQIIGATAENLYDFSLGMELASYSFDKYFTKKPLDFYPNLERIVFTGSGLKDFAGYKPFAGLANCVRYARDLINEPANAINPQVMAEDIKRLEYLGLQVDVLDEDKMRELGFNLAMAVGQGSANRPKIVVIKWKGNSKENGFKIGLVGKGVTFDSGGISIKPATNMGDMKQDMAGAAVMTATMKSVALQNIKQNIVAVVGLVENMPSGASYRPGDVIKSIPMRKGVWYWQIA